MANFSAAPAPPVHPRWLASVRIMALVCTLPFWLTLLMTLLGFDGRSSRIEWFQFFLFFSLPWSLPFFHVLFRVGLRRYPQKRGLALAVLIGLGWGGVALLFSLLWAAELGKVREGILIGVGALAPLALGVSAIKTYYSMEPEENDRKTLLASFGPFILYSVILFVTAVGLPGLV